MFARPGPKRGQADIIGFAIGRRRNLRIYRLDQTHGFGQGDKIGTTCNRIIDTRANPVDVGLNIAGRGILNAGGAKMAHYNLPITKGFPGRGNRNRGPARLRAG